MSTEITNNIDVSLDTTEVTQDNTKDIVNTNQHEVSLQQAEATVEGYKKEYSIVGDGLYASVTATETPQWLATLIDNVVANAIASGMTDYDLLVQDVRNAIDSIDVAKNTYVEQINVDAIVNGIVATHLDTLNATYGANFATKSELSTAIATTESAIAQNISDLSVSFADDLTSRVTNIQTAYAAADKVLAGNIDALSVAFIDQEANVSATADAVSGLQTYVGLGATGGPDGTGILSSIAILQKQNDGIIEFTIDTYDVMIGVEDPNNDTSNDQLDITKEPYASWVAADTASGTEEVRASHIGDVYIQYVDDVNGTRTYLRSYKFIKTAVDTSSPYSTDSKGYTWALITDTDAQSAYVAALNAQDLADSKRRVFTNTPYPPYDIGDLWVTDNGSGGAVLKRCSTAKVINTSYSYGDWTTVATDDYSVSVLSTGLSNGTVAVDLSSATIDGTTALTTYISNEIDKEVVVYSGSNHTTQTGMKTNDIYIEKTTTTSSSGVVVDVVNTYKYNGTSWVAIGNNSNITALADLADGKRTVFSGTAVPTGAVERDLWIPEADVVGTGTVKAPQYVQGEIYQYDGINWIATTKYTEDLNNFAVAVDGHINSLTSQIDQKIEYYFQASTDTTPYNTAGFPAGSFAVADRPARNGDVLYFTNTKKSYFYSSSTNTWNLIQDQDAIDAIADAAAAKGAADGKISQFYAWGGASAPTDYNVTIDGVVTTIRAANFKYWYKTNGKLYYKPSTTWIVVPTTSNTYGVTFVARGDLLSVFNPTTRDTTNYSYNGTSWQINGPDGVISKSKYFVDLENEVTGPNGHVASSLNSLSISSKLHADNVGASVENKFTYGSKITLNGKVYTSGFGLNSTANSGAGTEANPYKSDFWINAERFKFTNSNNTGQVAPFTIDARGTNPQITFNGKVSFNSITSVPDYALDSDARTYANTAKSNAISVASADATTKANKAKSDAENTASRYVATLANSTVREYWAACYGSSDVSNITYDTEEQAVKLYNSDDNSIGMCTPAQVKGDATSFKITVTFKSDITATGGVFFRVQEYDTAVLPEGKTHISYNAIVSESRIQKATRQIQISYEDLGVTTLCEDLGVTTSWQTKTFTYTPTSTAQNFSFLVLNWAGLGVNSLYIRDVSIVPQAPDISSTLPQTINRTYMPTASDVYPAGSIWRYSHRVTINGVASTEYTHYLSQGNGVWKDIGGTYIDGSKIVTGSINAKSIASNTITGDLIKAGTELRAPVINGAEVNIGDGGPYNGYHTRITSNGVIYTDYLVASGGRFKGTLDGCTGNFSGTVRANGGVYGALVLRASGEIAWMSDSVITLQGAFASTYVDVDMISPQSASGSTVTSGKLIDTGYVADGFFDSARQFIVTASRSGTWRYHTSKRTSAMAGFLVNPVPMQFTTSDATYNDARIYIHAFLITNYMGIWTDDTSKIKWKLNEILLHE